MLQSVKLMQKQLLNGFWTALSNFLAPSTENGWFKTSHFFILVLKLAKLNSNL
jgi:hypothetical protein